jgi:hypothetical protein
LLDGGGRIFRFHPQPSQQGNAKKGRVQAKAPAQEDPHPAVQAKQCSPVTIRRDRRSGTLKD